MATFPEFDYHNTSLVQAHRDTSLVQARRTTSLVQSVPSTVPNCTKANECTKDKKLIPSGEVFQYALAHGFTWEGPEIEVEGFTGPRMSKSLYLTWKMKLAVERGLELPARVNTVAAPEDCTEDVTKVWQGFVHMFACRWLVTYGDPAPFVRQFAAAWCGVTERVARDSILELRDRELMVRAGISNRAFLWLPVTTT